MMNILIVDDEPLARSRLRRLLSDIVGFRLVGEAANTEEAATILQQQPVDILLLDIQMPQQDGLAFAKQLLSLQVPPAVILVTAHPEHALDAYAVSPADYLLKPVTAERLQQALKKAGILTRAHNKPLSDSKLSYQIGGNRRQVDFTHIQYFVADEKYVKVVFDDGEALLETSLQQLEQKYPDKLQRIHRNTLVNWQRFDSLQSLPDGKYRLRLKGCDAELDVSRREASRLKHFIF